MPKLFVLLLTALVLTASACGSHPKVTVRHGTIEVRQGVPMSSLLTSVLAINRGSSAPEVRSAFGTPFTKVAPMFHGERETCWVYHARQPGTALSALDFCMNKAQRVERILIAVHL